MWVQIPHPHAGSHKHTHAHTYIINCLAVTSLVVLVNTTRGWGPQAESAPEHPAVKNLQQAMLSAACY